MARAADAVEEAAPTRLTADDWLRAAFEIMVEEGIGGVKVPRLCERLGVTKGSFYWHFKGREELLAAALARWERRATQEAVQALDAIPDYYRRLELILEAASQPPRARSLYAALAGAADEPLVKAALTRVGAARIDYLDACYRKLGLSPADSRARAVFAYSAYRGVLQLAHEAPASLPKDWSTYTALTQRVLLPDRAARPPRKHKA